MYRVIIRANCVFFSHDTPRVRLLLSGHFPHEPSQKPIADQGTAGLMTFFRKKQQHSFLKHPLVHLISAEREIMSDAASDS